jgi:hypothetical protein
LTWKIWNFICPPSSATFKPLFRNSFFPKVIFDHRFFSLLWEFYLFIILPLEIE